MEGRARATRPWVMGSICIVALLATWASYFAVYAVLPQGTPLAHWGLFLLALCFVIAYEATGSLLVPITMHALFNAGQLIALYITVTKNLPV